MRLSDEDGEKFPTKNGSGLEVFCFLRRRKWRTKNSFSFSYSLAFDEKTEQEGRGFSRLRGF